MSELIQPTACTFLLNRSRETKSILLQRRFIAQTRPFNILHNIAKTQMETIIQCLISYGIERLHVYQLNGVEMWFSTPIHVCVCVSCLTFENIKGMYTEIYLIFMHYYTLNLKPIVLIIKIIYSTRRLITRNKLRQWLIYN